MKPKILLVADVPNWAFDFRCNALWKHLGDRYEFAKAYITRMPDFDYSLFDVLYFAGFMLIASRSSMANIGRNRAVTSISGTRTRSLGNIKDHLERHCAAAALNRTLYETFRGMSGLKVDLIYNGVDCNLFNPGPRPNHKGFIIGWAGHPKNVKRTGMLAEAVKSIPGARLEVRTFKNRVPQSEMPGFYRSLDCYCCSSLNEGHSNTVAEAAACGIPVVSTPSGASAELLADGRGILAKSDLSDLVRRLQQAMAMSEKERTDMGAAARQYVVENWNWPRQAGKYAALFDYAMGDQR